MRLALNSPMPPDAGGPSPRQRATSLVLAVAATLLMIVAMISLNDRTPPRPRFRGEPVMLDLKADAETKTAAHKQAVSKPAAASKPPPPPRPVPVAKPPQLPAVHPYFIPLTREENEAADISKLRHADGGGEGVQQASAAGDSRPVGTAPDGEPLYDAQWYRRPTHAELSGYLPAHMPSEGWGLVACRTIARYHVDDCVELGSSPAGSHLAGVVRQAAWQFLVRPPRLGGKELVGTWVRIRIDYVASAPE